MMSDWSEFIMRMKGISPTAFEFRAPCSSRQLSYLVERLGPVPETLKAMLMAFNGAKCFQKEMPLLTLFGVSDDHDDPNLDWFVDRMTPPWRSKMSRPKDWVFAITNYGRLSICVSDDEVRSWDTALGTWEGPPRSANDWLEDMISEGVQFLAEA